MDNKRIGIITYFFQPHNKFPVPVGDVMIVAGPVVLSEQSGRIQAQNLRQLL